SLGGEVMGYRHLAKALGSSVRFIGVQARLEDPETNSSVERIARYYVDELMTFQPTGPFVLSGWSAGAVIALEMAQQLAARGRQAPLLVALDGAPFNTGAEISPLNPFYLAKLVCNLPRWIADDLMQESSFGSFGRRVKLKLQALAKKAY